MTEDDYVIEDLDECNLPWVAVDAKDQLAILQTMFFGTYPEYLRCSGMRSEMLTVFVSEVVRKGDVYGFGHYTYEDEVKRQRKKMNDWERPNFDKHIEGLKRTASRGFYLYAPYSSAPTKGGYVQNGYPSVPRLLPSLPIEIQRIVASYRLKDIEFQHAPFLDRSMWELK